MTVGKDDRMVVLLGENYNGQSKEALASLFSGTPQNDVYVRGRREEYINVEKQVSKGKITLRGTPVPFGRMMVWRSRKETMNSAQAFVVCCDVTYAEGLQYSFEDIQATTKETKKEVPVLVIGLYEKQDDTFKQNNPKMEKMAEKEKAQYISISKASLTTKDAKVVAQITHAITNLAYPVVIDDTKPKLADSKPLDTKVETTSFVKSALDKAKSLFSTPKPQETAAPTPTPTPNSTNTTASTA